MYQSEIISKKSYMCLLKNLYGLKFSLKYFWFSDFSLWSSEKMKLLFWKSFDSDCRQINGIENNWFSDFSEMIFIFLENENEMVKKDNQNLKKDNQNKKRITGFFMNLSVNIDKL